MKTAISLDGDLLNEADKTARQMGLSRSRLFALALEDYLQQRRREQVMDQLNEVYSHEPNAEEEAHHDQDEIEVSRDD